MMMNRAGWAKERARENRHEKKKSNKTGDLLQEVERAEKGMQNKVRAERQCMRQQWCEEGGASHPLPEPLLRGCGPFLERPVRERRGGPPDPVPCPALAPEPP